MPEPCDATSSGVEHAVNIATRGKATLALCQHHTHTLGPNLVADGWDITPICQPALQPVPALASPGEPAIRPATRFPPPPDRWSL